MLTLPIMWVFLLTPMLHSQIRSRTPRWRQNQIKIQGLHHLFRWNPWRPDALKSRSCTRAIVKITNGKRPDILKSHSFMHATIKVTNGPRHARIVTLPTKKQKVTNPVSHQKKNQAGNRTAKALLRRKMAA